MIGRVRRLVFRKHQARTRGVRAAFAARASPGNRWHPAYPAVVLPSMLLWGVANALIQPSLFACAAAAPRAELASGSAVLATARQLGSALGVAIFVAILGAHPARGLAGFDRAWTVVLITAAMTAFAGLATGRRLIRAAEADAPGRGKTVVLRDGSAVLVRPVQRTGAPLPADGFCRGTGEHEIALTCEEACGNGRAGVEMPIRAPPAPRLRRSPPAPSRPSVTATLQSGVPPRAALAESVRIGRELT